MIWAGGLGRVSPSTHTVTTGGPSVSTRSNDGSAAVSVSRAVVVAGPTTNCCDIIWTIDCGLDSCDVIVGPKKASLILVLLECPDHVVWAWYPDEHSLRVAVPDRVEERVVLRILLLGSLEVLVSVGILYSHLLFMNILCTRVSLIGAAVAEVLVAVVH